MVVSITAKISGYVATGTPQITCKFWFENESFGFGSVSYGMGVVLGV